MTQLSVNYKTGKVCVNLCFAYLQYHGVGNATLGLLDYLCEVKFILISEKLTFCMTLKLNLENQFARLLYFHLLISVGDKHKL